MRDVLLIGGVPVVTFDDALFSKLRGKFKVNKDSSTGLGFLTPDKFSFESLTQGGGKGGSLMAYTQDKRFIVKEMSNGDHQSLLRIASGYVE